MSLTDDDLRAYLDGTAKEAIASRIEAALMQGDTDLEERLRRLDPLSYLAPAAFEGLPDSARLSVPSPSHGGKSRGIWAAAAALVLGIGLGWGGALTQTPDPKPLGWRMQVALYQSLYVPASVATWNKAEFDDQFTRAEAALGAALPRDALRNTEGMKLRRVQVLGFRGKPLVQIVYQGEDGTPYALCLMRGEDTVDQTEVLAGLASDAWSAGGNRLILIGGNDLGQITELSAPLRAATSL